MATADSNKAASPAVCCEGCGQPAPKLLRCSCLQARYCNITCQAAAWPAHKLTCAARKARKAAERAAADGAAAAAQEFDTGDIVRIHGLASAAAQPLNDLLAEVLTPADATTGRIVVVAATRQSGVEPVSMAGDACMVKAVAVKPANLLLVQSALAAARASADQEPLPPRGQGAKQAAFARRATELAIGLHSMCGKEIVKRLQAGDKAMAQALVLPGHAGPSAQQKWEMNCHGLATAVLRQFDFPAAFDAPMKPDDDGDDQRLGVQGILCLANTLARPDAFGPSAAARDALSEARQAVCRRIGPALLIAASSKQRLFGRWEHWFQLQAGVLMTVSNSLICANAVRVMLAQPSGVVRALFTVLLRALFVPAAHTTAARRSVLARDPVIKQQQFSAQSAEGSSLGARLAVKSFMELADLDLVGVKGVERIGNLIVPAGAPEAGRTFADALLAVTARLPEVVTANLDCVQYLYSCFSRCPSLRVARDPAFEILSSMSGNARRHGAVAWMAARKEVLK